MAEKARVLVVDDDESIRKMLAKVVERQNLDVDTARDGEEAIELIDGGKPYSVILLDLMMPRVDGYGVLRHMQEHCPEKIQCTIIASAVPESEILSSIKLPIYKIHLKPFDIQKLLADIRLCASSS